MEIDVPMFRSGGFREFAISELGEQFANAPTKTLVKSLTQKAKDENWKSNRWFYEDTCHLCGWTGRHATIGKLWHITKKKNELYEHPKRSGLRPNFMYAEKYEDWICLKCIRESFPPFSGN